MKQIDELIKNYRDKEVKSIEASKEFAKQKMEFSEMTSQAFAFAYGIVQNDLETLKEQLKEQHKEDIDIYSGKLNVQRISEYSKLEELYNLERTTIAKIFCRGADWALTLNQQTHEEK